MERSGLKEVEERERRKVLQCQGVEEMEVMLRVEVT